jgi:dienelactone hydrolase
VLPGQDVDLKTEDGWPIKAKYSVAGTANMTLILLHGNGERKELWVRLARVLDKEGYGYLALDLRGHGESAIGPDGQPAPWKKFKATKTANDFEGMTRDIAAGVAWLTAQGVSEQTIGLIGTDLGGSVGLKYAAVHPKVPLIVLLSPGTHYEEVLTVNAIRAYKNRPILMIYSDADRFSSRDTPLLYTFAKMAAGEKNAALVTVPKMQGIRLPQSTAVIKQIVSWLANPVAAETPAGSTVPVAGQPVSASSGSVDDALSPGPDDAPAEEPAPMRPVPQDQ